MANIVINNYCNLKCEYCFASNMLREKPKFMTLVEFKLILMFLSKTREKYLGIIGGEPTLHPDFESIIRETNKYCRKYNGTATLYTNGICLDKFIPIIGKRIGILLNCNSPKNMPSEYWKNILGLFEHMDHLSWLENSSDSLKKITVGCNVYPGLTDYSYIWDLVDKYHIFGLRTSVVSPDGIYSEMRKDKEAYYKIMKPIFLEHCRNAIKHKCFLLMDCNVIPMCYFESDERELVYNACVFQSNHNFCEPVIDIKSNYKCSACFGMSDEEVDMRYFNDIIQLKRYLTAKIVFPKVKLNCTGKCTTCKKYELMLCQGGCLSFTRACKHN